MQGGAQLEGRARPQHILFILPKLLDAEDVQFLSVNVRQQSVGLTDRVAIRGAPTVPHQVHAVTWEGTEHRTRFRQFLCQLLGIHCLAQG